MSTERTHAPRIVVGVDGSCRSEPVLAWAAQHAANVGGDVTAVLAWQSPEVFGDLPPRVESELLEAAEKRLAEIVAGADVGDVAVTQVVREGGPVRLLTELSTDADLLVLGRHGHGSARPGTPPDKPLGSVVQTCVAQAHCPTVVVPVA